MTPADLPAWKRRALASLPWDLPGFLAGLLVLEMPDAMTPDWPSRDPELIARAALAEATDRLRRPLPEEAHP